MATAKSSGLVDFVIKAKQNGWGYVFGAQGQLYTKELAEEWAGRKRSGRDYDYFLVRCAKWIGKTVVDCSGLIIEAFRSQIPGFGDKSANSLFLRCVQTGMIDSIPEIPGLCVWRSGHIGLYIGGGKVVEAGGTNIGVVVSELDSPATSKPWTNWGKLANVDYEGMVTPPDLPEDASFWLGRYLKVTKPYTSGVDVKNVQRRLESYGFSPGPIDDIYGPKTESAVIQFQQSKSLEADGIVGPDTTKALHGYWVADYKGEPFPPDSEFQLSSFEMGRLLKLTSPYMRGDDVRDVQDALQLVSFSPGASDGIYGPKTENAVERFQKHHGLTADGIVGHDTTCALGGRWTGD